MLKLGKDDPVFLELFRDALPVEALSQEEGFWGYLAALHFVDAPEKDEQQGVEADNNNNNNGKKKRKQD